MSPNGNKIKKAVILAAGLGTRLKPVTYFTPKPMLKVRGSPLIDYNLKLLRRAGIKEAVINLHHLGGQIKSHVGNGKRFGLKVRYSNEPKILGTGGGIKKAEKFLKGGPFIVVNGDVLTKIDLKKVISAHLKNGGAATMVVRRLKRGEDYSKLDIAKNGRLLAFGRGEFMFTGIQILEPVIFKFLKSPSCLVESGYKKLLKHNLPVYTFLYNGYWGDIGTLKRYKLTCNRF